jgi:rRNA maturation protein Nop10
MSKQTKCYADQSASVQDRCPTCGEAGPDSLDVGDYGWIRSYEPRCGDDWHDDKPQRASDEDGRGA